MFYSAISSRTPTFLLGSCLPAFLTSSWGAITCIRRWEGAPKEFHARLEDLDNLHGGYGRINTNEMNSPIRAYPRSSRFLAWPRPTRAAIRLAVMGLAMFLLATR